MSVTKLQGRNSTPVKPNPGHRMILDILEGRSRLKADAKFRLLTVESSAMCATWDIGVPLSEHQCKAYRRLIAVKFGKTISYGELARAVGSSPRAIGGAMARNPFPLIVPCHRVIGADGSIGGWSPIEGIDLKVALLAYEAQNR